MSIVRGEGVLLKFYDSINDSYKPFACARAVTFNLVAETIGKSTRGSGAWKEKEIVVKSWDFSIEGITYLGRQGYADTPTVLQLWNAATPIEILCIVTDIDGNTLQMGGEGLITNVSVNGSVNNVSSTNVTGEGTGELFTNTSFRIIDVDFDTPDPGEITLTFDFDDVPGASAYTIRETNLTTGEIIEDTAGNAPRIRIINEGFNYSFALRDEPDGEFGYEIYWPEPPITDNYIQTGYDVIIDSDGEFILTE